MVSLILIYMIIVFISAIILIGEIIAEVIAAIQDYLHDRKTL